MVNKEAIETLVRGLRSQYEAAHNEAHSMRPENADDFYHQGYQSGRAAVLDSVITTLEMALAVQVSATGMIAPPLTDEQKGLFEMLALDEFGDLALVSTIEKATGTHRALVVRIGEQDDAIFMEPLAMLLDGENDIDLFERPSTDVTVH